MYAGIAMFILSNPLVYLFLGSIVIDIRNILGADIDRRTAGFNTNDPFIHGMYGMSSLGIIVFLIGKLIAHSKNR